MSWKISRGEIRVVDGHRYVGETCEQHVMPICRVCPQQWLCTRYAVETDVRTGTWGITYEQISWLKKQTDALSIIDHAKVRGRTVEEAVRIARTVRV